MDPNTGRLRSLSMEESDMLDLMQKSQKKIEPVIVEEPRPDPSRSIFRPTRSPELLGLEPLPPELHAEAEEALAGERETFIDLKGDSGLAKWAKKRRKDNKKKTKKKMAKKSRKINRKK